MIELLDAAEAEMIEAARDFELRAEGLGRRFLSALGEAFQRIETAPETWPQWNLSGVPPGVRHVVLRPFKYTVVYVLEPRVIVVAVRNARRHPLYWRSRLENL